MARGVNKVILIGNLGKDPETKTFPSGGSVTNTTLATSESWKGKDGQMQEHTEWHNLVFNDKLGEIVAKYLRKGSKIYVEGSIRTRKYQDKEGKDQRFMEIRVNEMQMLDGKPGGGEGGMSNEGGGTYGGGSRSSAPSRAPATAPSADQGFRDDPIDDIPF
ncbi:MAG: single-stranded DNA-binding protein [Panacagrimonas sp.]